MARWTKGKSGNPKGRPKKGTAIAGLARQQIDKHRLVEKLGRIGAGQAEYSDVDLDQQMRAIQLLLSYGYGPPRAELDTSEKGVVVQVIYAERQHQIAINGAALGAAEGDPGGQTIQRGLLRPPLGEDDDGNGPPDPSSTAR